MYLQILIATSTAIGWTVYHQGLSANSSPSRITLWLCVNAINLSWISSKLKQHYVTILLSNYSFENHFGGTLTCNTENGISATATARLVHLVLHYILGYRARDLHNAL